MKNTMMINHNKKLLIMDRTFAKNALNTKSEEYRHLQAVRKDYPDYEVVQKKIKINSNKQTYNGLTYDFMKWYINKYAIAEKKAKTLATLEHMIDISRCQSKAHRYPVIKAWFLEQFSEIANFSTAFTEEYKAETNSINENVVELPTTEDVIDPAA